MEAARKVKNVAVVLGTYNRKQFLVPAIDSVRQNAGVPVTFVVIDGGSTDGSREWLAGQKDVVLIGQRGPLTGAVPAFNLGFGYAVDRQFEYVFHYNDDATLETHRGLETALRLLEADPLIGEVAFSFDLRGSYAFEQVHDRVYGNYGLVRTSAGIEVAIAQGDPNGRDWWNPIYRTYGADTEFGCWLWKLGWKVEARTDLRVHDCNAQDELRKLNEANNPDRADSKLFWQRWTDPASMGLFNPQDRDWAGAKLHLGCGTHRLAGWVNADGAKTPATDVVANAFDLLRFIPKETLSWVYTSHVIEHIHPDRLPELLTLIRRALAPGGKLTIATIDFEKIYLNRFKTSNNGSAWNSALYGETNSTDHPYAAHRQCFTYDLLSAMLVQAGFPKVRTWQPEGYAEIAQLNDYAVSCRLVTCFAEGLVS